MMPTHSRQVRAVCCGLAPATAHSLPLVACSPGCAMLYPRPRLRWAQREQMGNRLGAPRLTPRAPRAWRRWPRAPAAPFARAVPFSSAVRAGRSNRRGGAGLHFHFPRSAQDRGRRVPRRVQRRLLPSSARWRAHQDLEYISRHLHAILVLLRTTPNSTSGHLGTGYIGCRCDMAG